MAHHMWVCGALTDNLLANMHSHFLHLIQRIIEIEYCSVKPRRVQNAGHAAQGHRDCWIPVCTYAHSRNVNSLSTAADGMESAAILHVAKVENIQFRSNMAVTRASRLLGRPERLHPRVATSEHETPHWRLCEVTSAKQMLCYSMGWLSRALHGFGLNTLCIPPQAWHAVVERCSRAIFARDS